MGVKLTQQFSPFSLALSVDFLLSHLTNHLEKNEENDSIYIFFFLQFPSTTCPLALNNYKNSKRLAGHLLFVIAVSQQEQMKALLGPQRQRRVAGVNGPPLPLESSFLQG